MTFADPAAPPAQVAQPAQVVPSASASYTAFAGPRQIAQGPLPAVAVAAKMALDGAAAPTVLVLDDATGAVLELDFRGTVGEFAARLTPAAVPAASASVADGEPAEARGRGRPRLGVIAREVTLLPRHWDWLATQPGGASVALRKLVEVAVRTADTRDQVRRAADACYQAMRVLAEHLPAQMPQFDEACRALFAGDQATFDTLLAAWPADVQSYLKARATDAFWA
jgi:uncharacterized protein